MSDDPIYSSYQGNPDLMPLVEGYVERLAERIPAFENSIKTGSWDLVVKHAHQLKGTAGAYGYPMLTEMAGRLELAATEHCAGEAFRVLEEMSYAIHRIESGLRFG